MNTIETMPEMNLAQVSNNLKLLKGQHINLFYLGCIRIAQVSNNATSKPNSNEQSTHSTFPIKAST